MKLILVAVNAKYIHTNLAVRYLKKTVEDLEENIEIKEFTVNQREEYILQEIFKAQPDILVFSCYIWNINIIHRISKLIKKVLPETFIVFGGPEVSFDTEETMKKNDAVDLVIIGEGEKTFSKLIRILKENGDYSELDGIVFRAKGEIFVTKQCNDQIDLSDIPFPYDKNSLEKDKIIYYESSRGCPFDCQYCLSSSFKGVRFLPVDRVKKEILFFIEQEVKQVKFVDRTFNASHRHALEIMQHILAQNRGKTNFHFEITADKVTDEMLEFFKQVPAGLFQFEIGIQSTNEETLKIVHRKMDFDRAMKVVKRISANKNIHLHLDLIAGLPNEDYFSFRNSFNEVFSLRPEKLQVGFLKLLKGSGLRNNAHKYGYVYSDEPPYEVLQNNVLTYGEIIKLKGIEEMVETYWNSRLFVNSIEWMLSNFYSSAFKIFEELWDYWEEKEYHHASHSKDKLYNFLLDFYQAQQFESIEAFVEVLKFDYLKNIKAAVLPGFFINNKNSYFNNKCHKFLQNQGNIEKYLPSYTHMPAKEIIKKVHFEPFLYNIPQMLNQPQLAEEINYEKIIVLFDYQSENKIKEKSKYFILDPLEFE